MMTEKEQLAWSSFMPALLACIGATRGPVLELGIGHFSTPALHALCGAMKQDLTSIEQDLSWFDTFEHKFATQDKHRFFRYEAYSAICWEGIKHIGVCFIDNSPGGENRKKCFVGAIKVSDYVVVHDYEKDNEEAIGPLLDTIPFKHITRTYEPPTLVASLTKPIPESILCL